MDKAVEPNANIRNKGARLRVALRRSLGLCGPLTSTSHIIGVHDALSARLAMQAGFDGVWVSSLCFSVATGRCDRDEITWTELADVSELISESIDIPVLVDGTDGCGDVNLARLLARRIAARGIAGLSLEDKATPRSNSLTGHIRLLDTAAFARKLLACRAAVDDDFILIARTDALIAGESITSAIDRASAYASAGADAVIVHSRLESADEIAGFMEKWSGKCPVLAIPTTYASTPATELDGLGLAAVIWANQLMRASMHAMHNAAHAIKSGSEDARVAGGELSLNRLLRLSSCSFCAGSEG